MDKEKRDLYADLELPGLTHDQALIKKQYKKLCMLLIIGNNSHHLVSS